jgi:hypothetical protein
MTARRLRAALAAPVLVCCAAAGLSACGSTGITAPRIDGSVAAAFANLWALQQAEEGHGRPTVASLDSTASCLKGVPADSQQGAGNDWVCDVTWYVAGPSTPVTAIYNMNVKTDGCYTADGDGPASVNGQRTISTPSGGSTVNPLWEFDGCFDQY